MTREQAINSMISHGFTVEQAGEIFKAVTPQEPILDKLRAEILEEHENAYAREDNDTAYGLSVALDILDKYKAEQDKA